ncbi:MAG: hypothetical protein NWE79_05530 [Candidatus Bathyarchaeota archaeon]|nr:hypothetical protein [Candidatus Bathyarchaeota archaeon]
MADETLYGILYMEYDSPEAAEKSARRYGGCPHVAFWATKGSSAYIVLAVNENKKFWAEYVSEHPRETFGGVKADLVFPDKVYAPLPQRKPPGELLEISPCGSDCATCPAYDNCPGCPATVHYKG